MKIVIGIIIATIVTIGVIDLKIYGYLSHHETQEYNRILNIQNQGNYNDARLEWDKFVTEYPFNTDAYAELAETEIALGCVNVTEADTPEANDPAQLLLSETLTV